MRHPTNNWRLRRTEHRFYAAEMVTDITHTHRRFIEMPQQCHEKVRSCMCVRGHVYVLGVSNERLVLRFFD